MKRPEPDAALGAQNTCAVNLFGGVRSTGEQHGSFGVAWGNYTMSQNVNTRKLRKVNVKVFITLSMALN